MWSFPSKLLRGQFQTKLFFPVLLLVPDCTHRKEGFAYLRTTSLFHASCTLWQSVNQRFLYFFLARDLFLRYILTWQNFQTFLRTVTLFYLVHPVLIILPHALIPEHSYTHKVTSSYGKPDQNR